MSHQIVAPQGSQVWKYRTIHHARMQVCSGAGTNNDRENHEIGQCPIHLEAPVSCSTRKCTLFVTQERMAWGDNLRRHGVAMTHHGTHELPRQIGGR